ncbi:MAG: NAD(+) synthase [Lachnospiraceae bacterium]|jgi:NAD+ synthase|nr:NAD(+) synthase [Lachnospiraceae bacterium]
MEMFAAKEITDRLVSWLKDYFEKNTEETTKAIIGISGGKDSAIVAALCTAAIGRERVLGVLLPQGKQADIGFAYDLCHELGIEYLEINIGEAVDKLLEAIETSGANPNDGAIINTPARIRMTTLYAIAAICGGRVANTGNLSEDWVGYSTKYGDMAGDFAPLSHFTMTEVKAIGHELGLSSRFIDKIPADGLTGRTDEENLGFSYELLDKYIRTDVCVDELVKEKIDRLHAMNSHKTQPIPTFIYSQREKTPF